MSKFFSKTIIIVALATLLWGGVAKNQQTLAATDCTELQRIATPTPVGSPERQRALDCLSQRMGELNKEVDWNLKKVGALEKVDTVNQWIKNKVIEGVMYILYFISLLANWISALGGNVFDLSLNYSILKLNSYTGILDAVREVWIMVRDILNITFIFILLWISIKTILGISGANTKKTIAGVVTAALLINFSLFATKIIIDASNMVAVSLYSSALKDTPPNKDGEQYFSSVILNNLGLTKLYAPETQTTGDVINTDRMIMLVVKIALALVTAWAFFAAAFMLIGRTIAFFVLMAFSPIGFMGDLIPFLKDYSKKWWDTLYNQALVAPIFILFMTIIVLVGKTGSFIIDTTGLSQIKVSAYFNFGIIIGLLILAVQITKEFSGKFGGTVTNIGAGLIGGAFGMVSGITASTLRNTAGKNAQKVLENQELKQRAAAGDVVAMRQIEKAKKTASRSFDIRDGKVGGFINKQLKGAGLDVNKGMEVQKGGFAKIKKDAEKKAEEEAKFYTEGVKVSDTEHREFFEEIERKRSEMERLTQLKATEEAAGKKLTTEEASELLDLQKSIAELDKKFSGMKDAKDKVKFAKEIMEKDKKEKILNDLAKRVEKEGGLGYTINNFISLNSKATAKIRADKIRKAIKSKSTAEQLAELAKKAQKESDEAEGGGKDGETKKPPEEKKPEGGGGEGK